MRLAILCSAHGFGHLARQLAVAEALLARGVTVDVWTAAPAAVVHDYLPGLTVVPARVDVGLVQSDSLTEDLPATARILTDYASEEAIDGLAVRLGGYDAAIVDIAPTALEACRRADVRVLAAGNFDWAWTYSHFPQLAEWTDQFARWQAPHAALQMRPGPDLTSFASTEEVGVVGRWRAPRRPGGVSATDRLVLVSFGGFGLYSLDRLLPRITGVTWILAAPMTPLDRPDCVYVDGVSYPALVGAADAVFTKPGYGIFSETALAGTPVVFVRRPGFPEAASLELAMTERGDVALDALSAPALTLALERLWSGARRSRMPNVGAARVADLVT
jgi:hypothetical protein